MAIAAAAASIVVQGDHVLVYGGCGGNASAVGLWSAMPGIIGLDALSSIAVLIGLVAAYVNPDWHLADAIAALLVSLFVFRIGWSLMWMAFRELADTAPTKEVIGGLQAMASEIPGVFTGA